MHSLETCSRTFEATTPFAGVGGRLISCTSCPAGVDRVQFRSIETTRAQIAHAFRKCIEEKSHETRERVSSCAAGCARRRWLCVVGLRSTQRGKGCRHREVYSTGAPPVSQRRTANAAGRRVLGLHGCRGLSAVTALRNRAPWPPADTSRDHRATFVLPAAALGRSLSDGGRPSGEVILCSILQVASSSGGQPRCVSPG